MKRYIKQKLYAGINVDDNGSIYFNWNQDSNDDIVYLSTDTSATYDSDNVRYVYGYEYNNSNKSLQKIVRDYLKGLGNSPSLYDEDVEEFVDNGVLRLEKYCNFSDFGAIVSVEPSKSPSLVDVIRGYLMEYVPKPIVSFQLIKNLYKDVQFDKDRAAEALRSIGYEENEIKEEVNFTTKKFDELKNLGNYFR